jgi:hypothetical protein
VSNRPAKFTQTEMKRLFAAAAKAGVDLRLEIRPDGTLIVGCKTTELSPICVDTELDKWMKARHENPA